LQSELGNAIVAFRQGGEGQGKDQERSNPRLEPTLPKFTPTSRKRAMAKKKKGPKKKKNG
jgi:hypothetical protein